MKKLMNRTSRWAAMLAVVGTLFATQAFAETEIQLPNSGPGSVAMSEDGVRTANVIGTTLRSYYKQGQNVFQANPIIYNPGMSSVDISKVPGVNEYIMLVGSPDANSNKGEVLVYRGFSTGDWSYVQTLKASDGIANDRFGNRVAISGNYAVVGALHDEHPGQPRGAAYVFEKVGNAWQQVKKLVAPDADPVDPCELYFSFAVAIDGDRIAISRPWTNQGGVYIFQRVNGAWGFEKKLSPPGGLACNNTYGLSVDIKANRVLVGQPLDQGNGSSGHAFLYKYSKYYDNLPVDWYLVRSFYPGDPADPQYFDIYYGYSVAIETDRIVIGAPLYMPSDREGAIYVYRNLSPPVDRWVDAGILTTNSHQNENYLGTANVNLGGVKDYRGVAISGCQVIGASSTYAYYFTDFGLPCM